MDDSPAAKPDGSEPVIPPADEPSVGLPEEPAAEIGRRNTRILMFVAGLALGLAAQVIVIPIAIFVGLSLAETVTSPSLFGPSNGGDMLMVGMMIALALVLEGILVAIVFAVSRIVQRIELFQGCLTGAIIGWLMYSGCWGLLATNL